MHIFQIVSLCVAVVGQTTEPDVVSLENDVHAMRQLLASTRDMQHHTSEAVFHIGHVAAALSDCKDTAAVAEAQMQEVTQCGLAASSAPELLGSAEAGTHILAETHAALQRVVAELTRACAQPASLVPGQLPVDLQPMLAKVDPACQAALSTHADLSRRLEALLARLQSATLRATMLASAEAIPQAQQGTDAHAVDAWRQSLKDRHAFLSCEGLAPLLANRLLGSLAVLAPDWTEDDNPCDNPEPAALDGESQPDAVEHPTFAMRRTAAAERYLQSAQQTSMCTQLARRLLVAEHSVAHEKTYLKLLVCQGAAL